ncbi:aminopeptidase [Chitinispirillum alkaliphilum]|nr:aminopeptidase [Chitinispirillum alkaliphilum]
MKQLSHFHEKCRSYLKNLCVNIEERCVGSDGNRRATDFFNQTLVAYKWQTEMPEFEALDWNEEGASLTCEKETITLFVSPYSLGCEVESELVPVSTVSELEAAKAKGKILFLHGEIAKEQLMPKNFVFYNPEEHQRIIAGLEKSGAGAIICATNRDETVAGGVYPFPLIEDGDFDIPSVYTTEYEGKKLLPFAGKKVYLQSKSIRIPGKGYNVIGKKGSGESERVVITAHIDSKKGSPGAIDNATGVVVLLLLAEMLKEYRGPKQIELVALNGEDYYAASGQMNYIMSNQGRFDQIALNINIDGAGYREGRSAFTEFPKRCIKQFKKSWHQILKWWKGAGGLRVITAYLSRIVYLQ